MRLYYKLFDLSVQLLSFITGVIILFLDTGKPYVLYAYFFVGAWQLLSLLVHRIDNTGLQFFSERISYAKTILWFIIAGVICVLLLFVDVPAIFLYLFASLLFTPLLAIWYMSICYREIIHLRKRDFIHLK